MGLVRAEGGVEHVWNEAEGSSVHVSIAHIPMTGSLDPASLTCKSFEGQAHRQYYEDEEEEAQMRNEPNTSSNEER